MTPDRSPSPSTPPPASKAGDLSAFVRACKTIQQQQSPTTPKSAQDRRRMVAAFCRMIAQQLGPAYDPAMPRDLAPRLRQTLERLLEGDSEKQIAAHLGLSRHTVHVYVKSLYKRFGVSSRAELLARWVRT